MSFLKKLFSKWETKFFLKKMYFSQKKVEIRQYLDLNSKYLGRKVQIDVYLPIQYYQHSEKQFPVIWFNDGQDLPRMKFKKQMRRFLKEYPTHPFIAVGIYANENRLQEYGTAKQLDYKKRGNQSGAYQQFILEELMPFIRNKYRCAVQPSVNIVAGFSLGGLSAFDIAWHHADIFGRVGVFSGSLWWRSKEFQETTPDADLIVHDMVRRGEVRDGQRYWFQAGTKDEDSDRNNNGIIDAIDDTLQLIEVLQSIGVPKAAIRYEEVENGIHHPKTWGEVMPKFLEWVFVY